MSAFDIVSGSDLLTMVKGLGVSVQVTALALSLGLPAGFALALLSESRRMIVRLACMVFVEVGRGTPILIVLYLVYFGLPQFGVTFPALASAVIALGASSAGYSTEIFRSAIRAVPQGQREAGASLSLSKMQVTGRIVLPQAVRIASPQVVSMVILFLQASALTFAVAIPELLSNAYSVGARSFNYLDVLIVAGLMYAAVCMPLSQVVSWLERRMSKRL